MISQARRRLRWSRNAVTASMAVALLTLVVERVVRVLLNHSEAAIEQGQDNAARVLLAVSDALDTVSVIGVVVTGVALVLGVGLLVSSWRTLRRARSAPDNPADSLAATVDVFGDLIGLLGQAHDDLELRMRAVKRAEAQQTAREALSTISPDQVKALRTEVTEELAPELTRGTRLAVASLILTVVLLIVGHFWK